MTNYTPNFGETCLVKFASGFTLVARRATVEEETRERNQQDWQTETPSVYLHNVAQIGEMSERFEYFSEFFEAGKKLFYDYIGNDEWDLVIERDEYPCIFVPYTIDERRKQLLEAIDEAVGELLVDHFPKATTGDIDPLIDAQYEEAVKSMVDSWINLNVPQECRFCGVVIPPENDGVCGCERSEAPTEAQVIEDAEMFAALWAHDLNTQRPLLQAPGVVDMVEIEESDDYDRLMSDWCEACGVDEVEEVPHYQLFRKTLYAKGLEYAEAEAKEAQEPKQ